MHLPIKLKSWLMPILLILVSIACGLPRNARVTPQPTLEPVEADFNLVEVVPTATQEVLPTPTPLSLPPDLVEVNPPLGSDFPLQGPLALYFNQPMDRPSVEIAVTGQPTLSGRFQWVDDSTVIFEPDAPYSPGSNLEITISNSALAINGKFLPEPIILNYQVVSPLTVLQVLPAPSSQGVDPASAVVSTFSQPVVPIGADPDSLPEAFTIQPEVPGKGQWVNTSTYIYYPDPAMAGGVEYTISLNPDIKSTAGSPFIGLETYELRPYEWTFQTASPRLVSIEPAHGADNIRLDTVFQIIFSQPMDATSVQENISLHEPNQKTVAGEISWNQDFTALTFTPSQLLARDTYYDLVLLGTCQANGGASLGNDYVARVQTVPNLSVTGTEPVMGGIKTQYDNLVLHFNGPSEAENPLDYFTFSPAVTNLHHWWDESGQSLHIRGDFEPLTDYTVTISESFPDPWGGDLGENFVFRFSTNALEPSFIIHTSEMTLFTMPSDATITAQATQIEKIGVRLGSITFDEMVTFLSPGGYDIFQKFNPNNQHVWTYPAGLSGDKNHVISLPITRNEDELEPGIYHLGFFIPELAQQPSPHLVVSSNVHLSFKLSTTNAFVWAVDLRNLQPVSGAPVTIYDNFGNQLASGATDALGVFQSPISTQPNLYTTHYAVMGNPGNEFFSISLSTWSQGVEAYDLGFDTDFTAPTIITYLYTDQPVYRPGATVHFRGVVRHEHNGRYAIADLNNLPVMILDSHHALISNVDLPLSEFGTLQGDYQIPEDIQPGKYQINTSYGSVDFEIAEYQLSDIDLKIETLSAVKAGEIINAQVEARYLFGPPVSDTSLTWNLYRDPVPFQLTGYQVGINMPRWSEPPKHSYSNPLGELISSGVLKTRTDGSQTISTTTDPSIDQPYIYTLEVTLTDESGLPLNARSQITVHPSDLYIGVRPDTWVGQAGIEMGFEIKGVDWERQPTETQELNAQFQKITWNRQESPDPFSAPDMTSQHTMVASADFRTAADGIARLAFTPPAPGIYQLEISGDKAYTQVVVWVGGSGNVNWPNLPNNHLPIAADKDSYHPSDTATIFIPNPLGDGAQALITVERDEILRYEVLTLDSNNYNYSLPLSNQDPPNIYISVTLIGRGTDGKSDFRQGYLSLEVEPIVQKLHATLVIEPEKPEPGQEIMVRLQVLDTDGNPVRGEFSIALVDQAALDLAEPNSAGILPAFYGEQPLGIRTGMSLVVNTHRWSTPSTAPASEREKALVALIRRDYQITAYWLASIITNQNGEAQATIQLPEHLTTWDLCVRGLTVDTKVGETREQVISTKDLLISPITPQFLVVGDRAELAAIVQNNSPDDLQVDVNINTTGFALDIPHSATQNHAIPAGGRLKVSWQGVVEDVDALELVFTAAGGEYKDAAVPITGGIPVLRYSMPNTFGTAGVLDMAGEHLETISLPRTFDPTGGTLQVEASPSLAAAITAGLDILKENPYAGSEQALSRFLPNLMAYRTIQDLGLESPELLTRLEHTLDAGLQELEILQNPDGGWGWWPGGANTRMIEGTPDTSSNTYLTAYVVYGLSQALNAGVFVDETMLQNGIHYLETTRPVLERLSSSWQLDRLAFQYYALARAGTGTAGAGQNLFEMRDQLSPYATAFLALTLASYDQEDERIKTLLTDLESSAIQTETGICWEGVGHRANLDTPTYNTAVAVFALAQQDPASIILPEAVRYLISHRLPNGSWGSTYETAWTLMALTQVMKGTGELAGDFGFTAMLNGRPLLTGQAGGQARLNPVRATIPIRDLFPDDPNGLTINRTSGPGRLYYAVNLQIMRPVAEILPINQGIGVSRQYDLLENQPLVGEVGSIVNVRLTITLENETYFLAVEDFIPAGAKILETSLKTYQNNVEPFDPRQPFKDGWGWWYFNNPQVATDHVTWTADYLPAGTYELNYTLVLVHPGEYQILPATAWEFYDPSVKGSSAGEVLVIDN